MTTITYLGAMKWLARKGNVGGTARWAAGLYERVLTQHPDMDTLSVYKTMIHRRMRVLSDPSQEFMLLHLAEQAHGLRGLVVSILSVEAGFGEYPPEHQRMFMEVIDEELAKRGLSAQVIYGSLRRHR